MSSVDVGRATALDARPAPRCICVGPIQGRHIDSRDGQSVVAEHAASAVRAADVGRVMIPGGFAADRIRLRHAMVDLVRDASRPASRWRPSTTGRRCSSTPAS